MRWRERCETLLMQHMLELKGASVRHDYSCTLDCRRCKNSIKVTAIQLTKELKESRHTLLELQASTAPTVDDNPKATPAPDVRGAGTEMTMYTAGTEMGGRKSCRE